jgi:hypothetical protein
MTQLPARYDHVGSFLRPQYLLEAREQKAKGEITPEQLRAVEDKAITEIVKFQRDVGLKSITDGEFRRTYFHIDFLEQLGGVKTDIPVTVKKPDGTRGTGPAGDPRDRQGAPRQGHPAGRLQLPQEPGQRRAHPQGDHPLAHHAALSRRARRHQQGGLPRAGPGLLRRRGQGLWGRAAQPGRRRLHAMCRWTTPTWPTCATTRCAKRPASAVTTPTSCRTATPPSSTRWWRKSPPACCWPCTCAAATSRARTRQPATTSPWPRRC